MKEKEGRFFRWFSVLKNVVLVQISNLQNHNQVTLCWGDFVSIAFCESPFRASWDTSIFRKSFKDCPGNCGLYFEEFLEAFYTDNPLESFNSQKNL